jgi:hypothetical protein
MKPFILAVAAVALSAAIAFAQGSGGGGSAGGGTSGGASTGGAAGTAQSGAVGVTPPAAVPLGTPPAPSDRSTVGSGPGVNPSNPQDLNSRQNPQDLTTTTGRNPSDTMPPLYSPPSIVAPERR